MDESGFSIGTIKAGRVIINASIRSKLQAQPGWQEWVTVVECICVDGTMISPLVIFKGETLSTAWVPASVAEDWRFSCNTKGWTSNLHGVEWLRHILEPSTRAKRRKTSSSNLQRSRQSCYRRFYSALHGKQYRITHITTT